jgi:hypothetical protein
LPTFGFGVQLRFESAHFCFDFGQLFSAIPICRWSISDHRAIPSDSKDRLNVGLHHLLAGNDSYNKEDDRKYGK